MQDEIIRSAWSEYFKTFSRQNEGRPTMLEFFGDLGAQRQENQLPLAGISLENSGPDAPRIEIMLGGSSPQDPRHLTHPITHVSRIFTKPGADGRDEALKIEDESGTQTLLRFVALTELSANN